MDTEGLRLLSLDGGGVRGLASLLILQRIMYNLENKVGPEVQRPLLPCNYFDMIAGTSTGGLIAIMLGVLRMDIDTCISKYLSMAPKIFPEEGFISRSKVGKFFKGVRGEARFDATNLEKVIKEMVSETFGDKGESALLHVGEDQPRCRTFVSVTNKDTGKPFRLRNYRSSWEPGTGCAIWQAARATSAAPLYFPPIRFGEPPTNYVDGGLNYNNPIRSLYDEARHVWGKSRRDVKCIVSIGTGVPPLKATGDTGKQILESVIAIATDTQKIADEFADEMGHMAENERVEYFRLNVDRGLEKLRLEEWTDFDLLTGATSYYLNGHKADLDRCADSLLNAVVNGSSQESSPIFLSDLPVSSHHFFGRASELSHLRTMLTSSPPGTGRQRVVLWGLGGFGKSRIALEYSRTYQKDYSAVLWINAATYESVEESFAQAATALRSRISSQRNPPSVDARANVQLVQQWLKSDKNKDWLLILDSLDDLDSFDCRSLIPQCSHGSIIVTSTLSHTASVLDFEGLETSGLDLVHGCEMLLSGVSVGTDLDKDIPKRIVRAMNGMPLAIEQARAMIKQGIPVRDFLGHFETQYERVMAQKPARSAWDYEKNLSLISIFNMLHTRLDREGDSQNILALASCFGPRPISIRFLGQVHQSKNSALSSRRSWSQGHTTRQMTWLKRIGHDRLAFHLALAQLENLCLVKLKKDCEGSTIDVSLHDSVSRWRLETMRSDVREGWIIAAAYALSNCLPEDTVDQDSQIRLLPLARHFYSLIRRYIAPQRLEAPSGKLSHQYGYLLARFANLYLNSQYITEGEHVFSQAVEYHTIFEASSWPSGRRSLLLLKGLAIMFSKNGKMEDAAETTNALHDASTKLLGPGHEITVWAILRLPVVRDRKIHYAENEQRAVIASRGEKLDLSTSQRTQESTPGDILQQPNSYTDTDEIRSSLATQLVLAASQGDTDATRLLLDRGMDANAFDEDFAIALKKASQNGYSSVVQLLLDRGAHVNYDPQNRVTALCAASAGGHVDVAAMLLSRGADINAKPSVSDTPLLLATLNGHHSTVQLLLEKGANVNAGANENCGTALLAADLQGNRDTVQLLLDYGADVNAGISIPYQIALYAAASKGYRDIVQLLLDLGVDINVDISTPYKTALYPAASGGYRDIVQLLLDHGADVNAGTSTPYQKALYAAASEGHRDIVQLLLDYGADVNAGISIPYQTALYAAASEGYRDIVQLLLNHGADVNAGTSSPCGTALHATTSKDHRDIVQLLLNKGADVNISSDVHGTALEVALRRGYDTVVDLLKSAGAHDANMVML